MMPCPKCGRGSVVKDSRRTRQSIRRQRVCRGCDHRWTTYETMLDLDGPISTTMKVLGELAKASERLLQQVEAAAPPAHKRRKPDDERLRPPPWSRAEESILRQFYPILGARAASHLPGRSKAAVYSRAADLGLRLARAKAMTTECNEG